MQKLLNDQGAIQTIPLLLIIMAIGILSFLVIISTSPIGGLAGVLNPKPASKAAPITFPPPSPSNIPGDTDKDGDVDIFDFNQIVTDFAQTGNLAGDVDFDNDVDIFDFNIVVTNFGRTS